MLDTTPILLAEDDKNDVFLMGRALKSAGFLNPICVVENGREVVDYLEGTGRFSQRTLHPLPCLMLLDLKMPLMDGFDVLLWLRGHPRFEKLPVVVLTASKIEDDIRRTRELGVYDYRVKPSAYDDLVTLLDDVRKCWLDERFNRFVAGQARS